MHHPDEYIVIGVCFEYSENISCDYPYEIKRPVSSAKPLMMQILSFENYLFLFAVLFNP